MQALSGQHFVNLVILVRINVSRVNVCGTHIVRANSHSREREV